MKRLQNQAFTLLELSVVMMVIALLIGGVLLGSTLMKNAQLQAVSTDIDRYKKAFLLFRDKYKALPGDMPNAQSFWGSDTGCNNTPYSPTVHITTCNGDGNGQISAHEIYRAWQHLVNANMISGGYAGMSGNVALNHSYVGQNIPASSLAGGGYTLFYQAPSDSAGASTPYPFAGSFGHVVLFGKEVSNSFNAAAVLTPAEALVMDAKLDDGLPGTGLITTSTTTLTSNANCITSNNPTTSQYNTSYGSTACNLIFITGF